MLSIGSAGSVLSIASSGSILSIGSAGSILSVASAGSILSVRSQGRILAIDDSAISSMTDDERTRVGVAAAIAASVIAVFVSGRSVTTLRATG